MRADRGVTVGQVAITGDQQGIGQRQLLARPAGLESQRRTPERGDQVLGDALQFRLQSFDVVLAPPGERLAGFGQFVIPRVQLAITDPGLEELVALLQRAGIPTPQAQEVLPALGLLHVEQAPVDQASPRLAAAGDQRMAAGFERHHGKGCAQFAQLRDGLPVQAPFPPLSEVPQSSLARTGRSQFLPFGEDFDRFGAGTDQPVADASAEASPVGQQMQGFEQTGLAGAVVAGDEVDAWSRREFDRFDASYRGHAESGHMHAPVSGLRWLARKRNRPGVPGRRVRNCTCSTWNRTIWFRDGAA
jgi:hypothetical protein